MMSFGLTNAQESFTDLISHVFKNLFNKFVIMFIVNILNYARTREGNAKYLRIVF